MKRASRLVVGGVLGFVLFAGACWTTGCSKEDDVAPQARLEKETGTRWVVKIDPVTGTPRIATAIDPIPPSAINGVSYEIAARSFLDKYKDLFQLKDVFQDLGFLNATETATGEAIAIFQQRGGGLPIDGKLLTVSFRNDKSIVSIAGATRPRAADAVTTPTVTADAARSAAEADIRLRFPKFDPAWIKTPPKPESVLFPDGAGAKLAWAIRVDLEGADVSTTLVYRVDALSGGLLEAYEDRPALPGTGTDVLGTRRPILITEDGTKAGTFLMVQPKEGGRSIIATGSYVPQVFPITSTKPDEWDIRATFQGGVGAAVSAHANLADIENYFRSRFKWGSFDGKDSPLKVFVHDTRATAQSAYWSPVDLGVHFDDGTIHNGGPIKPFAGALDICAHEFTHGVMQFRIPGGGLKNMNESGAVNEAIADIFGLFAKKASNAPGRPEIIGDAIYTAGYRDLQHPSNKTVLQNSGGGTPAPSSFKKKYTGSEDGGGVHINAGIIGNAWWLMTMGGVNDTSNIEVKNALGIEKSEELWWNAVLAFQPSTTISDAAEQTIATALNMFKAKSPEFAAVACAWVAVEVMSADDVKADFNVQCGQPCINSEAGAPICSCRASDPKDGSLCKVKPQDQLCRDVQNFDGETGKPCSGYVLHDVEISRCFCEQPDGNILCPQPYQFTPPRGCPDPAGFKSYFGNEGEGCSGNYAGTDADGNEINKSGSGTLKSCSIEGTDRKWESATGVMECAGGEAGTNQGGGVYECK